jgi:hypothetical protein
VQSHTNIHVQKKPKKIYKTKKYGPSLCRRISSKEETLKLREFNQFQKKVPKNAEAANIQVGSFAANIQLKFLKVVCNGNIRIINVICNINIWTKHSKENILLGKIGRKFL